MMWDSVATWVIVFNDDTDLLIFFSYFDRVTILKLGSQHFPL